MEKSTIFAILLGGNLGNTEEFFLQAEEKLAIAGASRLCRSTILRNPAVGCVPGTPEFCNAALTGVWPGTAEELLHRCQQIERESGRPRRHSSAESRTLDLDLILFGDERINTPELTVPHPRARQRRFVLGPLAEIAPALRFPDTGETVADCLKKLPEEI